MLRRWGEVQVVGGVPATDRHADNTLAPNQLESPQNTCTINQSGRTSADHELAAGGDVARQAQLLANLQVGGVCAAGLGGRLNCSCRAGHRQVGVHRVASGECSCHQGAVAGAAASSIRPVPGYTGTQQHYCSPTTQQRQAVAAGCWWQQRHPPCSTPRALEMSNRVSPSFTVYLGHTPYSAEYRSGPMRGTVWGGEGSSGGRRAGLRRRCA